LQLRFVFVSDTSTTTGDGWMIDNFMIQKTYFHTVVKNAEAANAIKVYPTAVKDFVYIGITETSNERQLIKDLKLYDGEGKLLQQFEVNADRYHIDMRSRPNGIYYLKVNTNKSLKTFPILLSR